MCTQFKNDDVDVGATLSQISISPVSGSRLRAPGLETILYYCTTIMMIPVGAGDGRVRSDEVCGTSGLDCPEPGGNTSDGPLGDS